MSLLLLSLLGTFPRPVLNEVVYSYLTSYVRAAPVGNVGICDGRSEIVLQLIYVAIPMLLHMLIRQEMNAQVLFSIRFIELFLFMCRNSV